LYRAALRRTAHHRARVMRGPIASAVGPLAPLPRGLLPASGSRDQAIKPIDAGHVLARLGG